MLKAITRYQTVLGLSIAAAVANGLFWGLVFSERMAISAPKLIWCTLLLIIPFGIWLQSSFIRYASAVSLAAAGVSLLWPLASTGVDVIAARPLLAAVFVIVGVLNLLTACVLLFSKTFGREFADERKHQAKYKVVLKRILIAAITVAVSIAILIELLLPQSPSRF